MSADPIKSNNALYFLLSEFAANLLLISFLFCFSFHPLLSIILENDSASIVQRVVLKNDDLPIGEQTVAQVFQNAKENFKWSLLRS